MKRMLLDPSETPFSSLGAAPINFKSALNSPTNHRVSIRNTSNSHLVGISNPPSSRFSNQNETHVTDYTVHPT